MQKRGGGICDIELIDLSDELPHTYQFRVSFNTVDSMGANFINSVLEAFSKAFVEFVQSDPSFGPHRHQLEVIMSILSNYTPECLVKAWVTCPVEELGTIEEFSPLQLAQRFKRAVDIAMVDPYRATTHNKGIFNGIDAVVLATANDFRAVEANGHAFASRDGRYRSLTQCTIRDGVFKFWIEIPLAVGTIGGLTSLHPMAKRSLELLGNPTAEELMMIIASMGLAQNFAAVKSLITTGIQQGHMRMHLVNILSHLEATEAEVQEASKYFQEKVVSFSAVREFLQVYRRQRKMPVREP
jgi:hydroxymethylglutaryl-CoA reductase